MAIPILRILILFAISVSLLYSKESEERIHPDACVYGASPAGIMAAAALAREGYQVALIEPMHTIGGLLAFGFRMQQDVPDPQHLGGMTREFYDQDVSLYPGLLPPGLRHLQAAGPDNVRLLQGFLDRYAGRISVVTHHRIVSAQVGNEAIREAVFEEAVADRYGVPPAQRTSDRLLRVSAKIFIDASYEGDLMALAGVPYRIGRESRAEYGESLAGVVVSRRFPGVDPYKIPGKPESGLLSPIRPGPIGKEGDASPFFMSWNLKMAWEMAPSEKYPGVPMGAPLHRDEDVYELLRRYESAGFRTTWPDENFRRTELLTGAIPGFQTEYPDGDWATRSRIWQGFIDHVRSLTERSGKDVRLLSDYCVETSGWPCLYMRGGRRMIGEYVMTQQDLQLQTDIPHPIGMGYYKVDIYPTRLGVDEEGVLVQEGEIFSMISPGPYQIPYGAIIPKKGSISNLLVPMMMSATHVAYSSIRMEGTYMVMGEASGIAAALALKSERSVQGIDRDALTALLEKYGAELKWDGTGFYTKSLWRSNIFGKPSKTVGRWVTNPEEYSVHPVQTLWKTDASPMP